MKVMSTKGCAAPLLITIASITVVQQPADTNYDEA